MRSNSVRIDHKTPDFIAAGERIRPLRDRIVVRPLEPEHSDILTIPWLGKPLRGEVIAAGPGSYPKKYKLNAQGHKQSFTYSNHFQPTEVKPGDIVELGGREIGGYMFPKIWINGIAHVICQEADVCGVIPQEQA